MVFRHKTPIAGVCGVVSDVALSPVLFVFERVAVGLFAVDIDFPVSHFQFVSLIDADRSLVDRKVFKRKRDALTLLRNPYGTVIVARPSCISVERIDPSRENVGIGNGAYRLDKLAGFQLLCGIFGERKVSVKLLEYGLIDDIVAFYIVAVKATEASNVFFADAELFAKVVKVIAKKLGCRQIVQFDKVGVLYVVGFFVGFSVALDNLVLDLKCLSREPHTTFDIVFATVGRAPVYHAISIDILEYVVAPHFIGFFEEGTLLKR